MTALAPRPPTRRGTCPGVADPMATGDGWLIRIRLPGGAITAPQLDAVASMADAAQVEVLEVTGRANLQLRVPGPDRLELIGAQLLALGLAASDPAGERARAVLAPPLRGHDRQELDDTSGLVEEIVVAIAAAVGSFSLPARWTVAIDVPATLLVPVEPAHVVVRAVSSGSTDGSAGDTPRRWSVGPGRAWSGPATPAAVTVARRDVATVVAQLAVLASDAPVHSQGPSVATFGTAGEVNHETSVAASISPGRVGFFAHPDEGRTNLVVGSFLGRLDPVQLRTLAAVPAAAIRFTHARAVALAGLPDDEVSDRRDELAANGLTSDPTDPMHRISACIGAPGCDASEIDTAAAAQRIVTRLGPGQRVHISGCAKRCGEPADALAVVGSTGVARW